MPSAKQARRRGAANNSGANEELQKQRAEKRAENVRNSRRSIVVGGPMTALRKYQPPGLSVSQVEEKLNECKNSDWKSLSQADLNRQDYYFNSYSHMGIHEEMLRDKIRTSAYQRAILDNPHLFADKIVLDVGAGTGILSMFAARAGARHVFAIECSQIAFMAEKIIEQNGLSEKITVIHSLAEDATLPVPEVDIIVSEWMGYFLLYESMLDSVLFCRDKWLKKDGGLIFPDVVSLHIALLEDGEYREEKLGMWNDCYGFDYTPAVRAVIEEPLIDFVEKEKIVTNASCVLELNLKTAQKSDVDFASAFELTFQRSDYAHALVAWFDCEFSACHVPVVFSTGPQAPYTHWKNVVFYLDEAIIGNEDESMVGMIVVRKNKDNVRELDVKFQYDFCGKHTRVSNTQCHRIC